MYRIKNTADDRTKHLLHRTASRFELEPVLGARRIRLGEHYDITDEHYEKVKHIVAPWVKKGMVEVIKLDSKSDSKETKKETKNPASDVLNPPPVAALEFNVEPTKLETLEKAEAQVESPKEETKKEEVKKEESKKGPGRPKKY